MFRLKGCPRCSGDVFVSHDQYGPFVTCIQCGLSKEVTSQPGQPLEIMAERVLPPPVPQWDGTQRRRVSHGGRHFAGTFAPNKGSAA